MKSPPAWTAYHVYYHQDLDRAVVGFVRPLAARLLAAGSIDRLFFVRYRLGGPHLRLRLRVPGGRAARCAAAVEEAARGFLRRHPSTEPLAEEAVRRETRALVDSDPFENDDTVYPDNTFLAFPFQPETDRYGGAALLPHSLDFFAASTAAALEFVDRRQGEPRGRWLAPAGRLLLRQAAGFAGDRDELVSLLGYAIAAWGERRPAVVAKGDRVYEGARESFLDLVREEIAAAPPFGAGEAAALLGPAARRLADALDGDDPAIRRQVGVSQLHMTANRLGLINPEEVYLGRLLGRACADALADGPLRRPEPPAGAPSLAELTRRALATCRDAADEPGTG